MHEMYKDDISKVSIGRTSAEQLGVFESFSLELERQTHELSCAIHHLL
jgi:hypothetical protein